MKTLGMAVLALALVLPAAAWANEDEEESRQPELEVALHWIGGLTKGHPSFTEQPLGIVRREWDQRRLPLFGEREQRFYPWGSADEVIELVKSHVAPRFWEEQLGANIAANEPHTLVVRATRKIHEDFAAYLSTLEADAAPIRVRLVAVQAPPATLGAWARQPSWTEEQIRALSGARLGVSVATTDRQNATIARGAHRALVTGMDAHVKGETAVKTPLVEIGRYGIVATVKPYQSRSGDVRLQLDVSVATVPESAPVDAVARWNSDVTLPAATWRYVGAASGAEPGTAWGLFAQATPNPGGNFSPARPAYLPKTTGQPQETMTAQRYAIGSLVAPCRDRFPTLRFLQSSWEDARTPIEDGRHEIIWGPDYLVELLQVTAGGETDWETGTIMVQNGQLFVRNQARIHEAIQGILGVVRKQADQSFAIDLQVLDQASDPDAPGPDMKSAAATVVARPGQRNYTSAARRITYVGALEATVGDGHAAATPLQRDVDLGLTVEIHGTPNLAGDGIHLDLRFVEQSEWNGTARSTSVEGTRVELPTVGVHRGQTSLHLKFGQTATVFSTDDGKRNRVVRVHARSMR